MRNAYLLAVAPNQLHQHPFRHHRRCGPADEGFSWRRKGRHAARVAPELSMDTYWYYKTPIPIDQKWSVRGLRRAPAPYRPGPEREPVHHQRIIRCGRCWICMCWPGSAASRPYTVCAPNQLRWRNARAAPPEAALCGRNGQEEQGPRTGAGRGERAMEMLAKNRCSNLTETPTSGCGG